MPCSSRIGTVALTVALMLGVVAPATAQSAQRRFDVFAGGGVVSHDNTSFASAQVGGGVWAGQYLRVGGRVDKLGFLGLLSAHLRLPLNDDADLLVGTTPIWYAPDLWIAPTAEVLASARVAPRLRVEFGPSIFIGDGGFVHLMGRAVYSFD